MEPPDLRVSQSVCPQPRSSQPLALAAATTLPS